MSSKRRKLKKATDAAPKSANIIHDRLADIAMTQDIGIAEMPDPYAIPEPSTRERAGETPEGEWKTPERPRVRVIQSFRRDPIGRMFARHQIGDAEHQAARDFQDLHDDAQIGVIRSIDPAKEAVDGGALPDVLTDKQQSAIRRIRTVERAIKDRHGAQGLVVLNGVIVAKLTVEQVANSHGGPAAAKKVEFWRGLFRETLQTLGVEMGTISRVAA